MVYQVSLKIGNEELILETGRMAKQANGAVFAQYGGSAVLATICAGDKEEDFGYLPLSAGQSFFKKNEGLSNLCR